MKDTTLQLYLIEQMNETQPRYQIGFVVYRTKTEINKLNSSGRRDNIVKQLEDGTMNVSWDTTTNKFKYTTV